jgi:hypothetical protein
MLLPGDPRWQDRDLFPNITVPVRGWCAGGRRIQVREGRSFISITLPERVVAPIVLNWGRGTDSTALICLLIAMVERGGVLAKPDLILFADTGSEKANTNDYDIDPFLKAHGLSWTRVQKFERNGSYHTSLHQQMLTLETMPSPAYGSKSCSLKWKADEMDYWLRRWPRAQAAWACGLPVHKLIGYDASPADLRRSTDPGDEQFQFHYPLRAAGLKRDKLQHIIAAAGLPDPGKSACFMCPAMKKPEILALAESAPEQLAIALTMEARALLKSAHNGKLGSTKGLGRTFAWREFLRDGHPELLRSIEATHDTGREAWFAYQALLPTTLSP